MAPSELHITQNQNLAAYNTFGIEEHADYFCEASDLTSLKEALSFAIGHQLPVHYLGGGSNILLTKPFHGLVVHIANLGISVLEESRNEITVRVAAGENWHSFVLYCLEKGWFGIENLSLIPGSVGAAPMQNIGAYGVEVKQTIDRVHFLELATNDLKSLNADECRFGYRESIFKQDLLGKVVIWQVDFRLSKVASPKTEYGDIQEVLTHKGILQPTPKDISNAVIQIRKSKLPDPAEIGNAGSFFKNPVIEKSRFDALKVAYPELPSYPAATGFVKVPAGWLIEKAGWKGKRFGNYGVHARQALVLVNYGGARGVEIYGLATDIQKDVEVKFGISLQMEVNLI